MGSKFIPIRESIPSIPMRPLRNFADEFGSHMTDEELARALQRRGPARRKKRVQSPRSVKLSTWNKADCVSVIKLHLAE